MRCFNSGANMEWFERAIRVHKMTPLTFVCYTMRDPKKKKSKKFDQIAIWAHFARTVNHMDGVLQTI